jgi:arylsulfatase A-like enzyme
LRTTRALPLLLLLLAACSPSHDKPPSIILISIDSLRRDALSAFGCADRTSPHIDALAEAGVKFSNAVSTTSWTMPSHHALLRGLYDDGHGALVDVFDPAALRGRSIAEVLHEHGYATAGYFSGPYLHPAFGFDRGFEDYQACYRYATPYDPKTAEEERRKAEGFEEQSHGDSTSAAVVAKASDFLARMRREPDRPFFLFLHFFDVHYDYLPPKPFDRSFVPRPRPDLQRHDYMSNPAVNASMPADDLAFYRGLYHGEVAYVDDQIGRLLSTLPKDLDVVVAIVSDHGDEFFEHGEKGHRKTVYGEVTDVPVVLWSSKGRVPAGVSVASRVRTIDVAPTLLELAGVKPQEGVQSESLLPLCANPGAEPAGRSAWLELELGQARQRALIDGSLKLIGRRGADGTLRFELYDLVRDPGEQHDLAGTGDPREAQIAASYNRMLDRFSGLDAGGRPERPVPEDVRRDLAGVGYVAAHGTRSDLAELRHP